MALFSAFHLGLRRQGSQGAVEEARAPACSPKKELLESV